MAASRFRRSSAVAAVVASLVLGLAACADDDDETASASASEPAPAASETASSAPVFPVSIEHAYGTAVIEKEPTRVVALGYQEQDAILALGLKPIAARYWFGPEDDVIYPWAEEAAGDAKIEILTMNDGIEFEKIAALNPDLILGVYSDLDQTSYDRLSKVAPTVARPKDYIDYGTPWDVQLEIAGKALGKSDLAEQLIDDLKGRFAEIKESHPEWGGKELAVGTFDGELLATFAGQDPRPRFFQELGFASPKEIDEQAGTEFYLELSKEEASLLDRDLLVWDQLSYLEGGRETIENDPIFGKLDAMEDGRVVYTEGDMEFAYAFNTVLSLPYVLDRIVPLIEDALDSGTAESETAESGSASESDASSSASESEADPSASPTE